VSASPHRCTALSLHKVTFNSTLIGTTAVLIWSTLALLSDLSGAVPPFQLTAMAFAIAFCLGMVIQIKSGDRLLSGLTLPPLVWAIGICGLFGYHFTYFVALQNAPVIEASLISYLWPLLIVFSLRYCQGSGCDGFIRWVRLWAFSVRLC